VRASLSLLLAAAVVPLLPLPAPAAEVSSSSQSTVAETGCVIAALKTMDQSLEKALARVAKEAKVVPSEVFQTLWRDNLTGFYKPSADPKAQASAFRAERRKICASSHTLKRHDLFRVSAPLAAASGCLPALAFPQPSALCSPRWPRRVPGGGAMQAKAMAMEHP
jgi:hypothetical protein